MRGWSNDGTIKPGTRTDWTQRMAPLPCRQNAKWNDREDYDLCEAFTRGVTITKLADRHGRSRGAILMRTERCLDGAARYMEAL